MSLGIFSIKVDVHIEEQEIDGPQSVADHQVSGGDGPELGNFVSETDAMFS